jgi:LacI family transcriptional regulator
MNRKSSAPTLLDVARMAGVSTATVSRCFNSPDRVVDATREKVQLIVEEIGYTPNFGGRALASNRSNTVGAIIPTMDNAIFARGLQAFQETLAENKVTLLVASSGYDPERELQQIRSLISQGADGLLLIGHARPEKTYDFLHRRQIPFVVTWNYRADSSSFNVGFDNRKAATQIAQQVLNFEHKRIAIITAHIETNDRTRARLNGVRDAMQSSGIPIENLGIISTTNSLKSGGDAFEDFMSRTPRPTVIMCGNDVLATGAIIRANEMAIKIPDEVSVTGFDDIDLAEVIQPNLTTVHVPHRRMGESAARLLLDIIDDKKGCESVELETEVIIRQSLGPAKR